MTFSYLHTYSFHIPLASSAGQFLRYIPPNPIKDNLPSHCLLAEDECIKYNLKTLVLVLFLLGQLSAVHCYIFLVAESRQTETYQQRCSGTRSDSTQTKQKYLSFDSSIALFWHSVVTFGIHPMPSFFAKMDYISSVSSACVHVEFRSRMEEPIASGIVG